MLAGAARPDNVKVKHRSTRRPTHHPKLRQDLKGGERVKGLTTETSERERDDVTPLVPASNRDFPILA
jgi:hypothetical protein